jgi:hypothetical protein
MTTPFDAIAAKGAAARDRVMGERLLITPMLPGRYKGGVPDETRPAPFTLTGTVVTSTSVVRMNDNVVGRDFNSQWASDGFLAFVSNDEIAGRDIRAGDRVQRIDRPGQPLFEINLRSPDGAVGMFYRLVEVEA